MTYDNITSLIKSEAMGIIIAHFLSLNFAPANNATAIIGVILKGWGIILKITAAKIKPEIKKKFLLDVNFSM